MLPDYTVYYIYSVREPFRLKDEAKQVFWAVLPEVLPSKWHSVPEVGLVLKPDATSWGNG